MYAKLNSMAEGKILSKKKMDLLSLINYRTKKWIRLNTYVTHCPKTKAEAKEKVLRARAEIATKFRISKENVHADSDPGFLDPLSECFDIRNWNIDTFENEFQGFLQHFIDTITNHEDYFTNLNVKQIKDALIRCLTLIKKENMRPSMSSERHIIDQWRIILEHPRSGEVEVLKKAIKRIQLSPNAQSGCERSNSKYSRFKNKYSNRMGIEIIRARSRAGENGPPLTMFPRERFFKYWVENNHKLALKVVNDKSIVLERRKVKAKQYTSKMFLDL